MPRVFTDRSPVREFNSAALARLKANYRGTPKKKCQSDQHKKKEKERKRNDESE